ncbi:MAG TPA: hypothetical protein VLS91_06035 [Acidimicrobiales bacterium]|nr:hypothetical protein [Acidimicrobiales bacterium]
MSAVSEEELQTLTRLVERGRSRSALRRARSLEARFPDNPIIHVRRLQAQVQLHQIAFADAETEVRGLTANGDFSHRLAAIAVSLRAMGGDREGAILEIRDLISREPDVGAYHQTLAGLLQANKNQWEESWAEYNAALKMGPLTNLCYKTAAYYLGRRIAPSDAVRVLQGTTSMEKAIVKTRSLNPEWLVLSLITSGIITCLFLGMGDRLAGLALVLPLLSSAGWMIFANDFARCKKCRNTWMALFAIGIASCAYFFNVGVTHPIHMSKTLFWMIVVWVGISVLVRWDRKRLDQHSTESESVSS